MRLTEGPYIVSSLSNIVTSRVFGGFSGLGNGLAFLMGTDFGFSTGASSAEAEPDVESEASSVSEEFSSLTCGGAFTGPDSFADVSEVTLPFAREA